MARIKRLHLIEFGLSSNDIKKDNDAIKAYFDKTYRGIRPEFG